MNRTDEETREALSSLEERLKDAIARQGSLDDDDDDAHPPGAVVELEMETSEAFIVLEALAFYERFTLMRDLSMKARKAATSIYRAIEDWRKSLKKANKRKKKSGRKSRAKKES